MDIVLARHGETEWNVEEIFRGRVDIELNERGLKQAALLAEHLSGAKVEAVYSSPLKRALRTAQLIARPHSIEARVSPGLVDLDFGEWQGRLRQEVAEKDRERYLLWTNHPEQLRLPSGESLDDVRERALAVVQEAVTKHRSTAVLVTHRVIIKVLLCALLGLDNSHFWNFKQDTAAITIFSYEGDRFVLIRHNDTCHLRHLQKTPPRDF